MIEIIVTMCLIGTTADVHPTDLHKDVLTRNSCRLATKVYLEDPSKITPLACMQNAQKFAIEWLKWHPGYQVRAIGCRPHKDRGQEI